MILMFDKKSWYNSIFRNLFGGIDSLIYSLISWIIEGIFNLANVTANGKLIESIYNRVYLILSIYMIFKLTVSFLRYMASPDMMNDREQGVGKLIARTFTMIALIIAMPLLFFNLKIDVDGTQKTLLVALQDGALNTLPKLILGVDSAPTSNSKESGDAIAMMMIRNFYYPMECKDNPDDPVCIVTYTSDGNGNVTTSNTSALANFDELENTLDKAGSDGKYAYYYMWPVSTVVGIAMVVILLGLCIDVAIRIFKIIGLEMIAPIPIMSYIDPKSSKDSGMFSNWVKNFISTYISIFINLGVLYLVLLLISKLMTGELFDSGYHVSGVMSQMFLNVFLIIGLLQFAKQAPKFFKDALGIKDKGGSSFMGKAAAGLGGAAAGFAGGVAGGGGLAGGLASMSKGFGAAADAAGTGKKANVFGNTRDDIAKKMGKTPGGLNGKMQQAALKRQLSKMGISNGRRDAWENEMLDAQKDMEDAQAAYDSINPNDPKYNPSNFSSAADAQAQLDADRAAAKSRLDAAKARYANADKNFKKQDKSLETAGAKPGAYDKYHRGVVDNVVGKGKAVYNAVRHPVANAKQIVNDVAYGVSDTVKDTFHIRDAGGKRNTDRRNDARAANYTDGVYNGAEPGHGPGYRGANPDLNDIPNPKNRDGLGGAP